MLTPATCGCVEEIVDPPTMKTLGGETVTRELSLLISVTNMPPGGAGVPKDTGNAADCPNWSFTFGVKVMVPGASTVMLTLVGEILGGAFVRITVEPPLTAVTAKLA